MTITRTMRGSEFHNTYYKQNFEVVDELPKLNEPDENTYEGTITTYTYIIELLSSAFTGEDRAYDGGFYRYYRVWKEIQDIEDAENIDEEIVYFAVWEEYEFEDDCEDEE